VLSSIEKVLSIAYAGHRNETLRARVRPSLEKRFAAIYPYIAMGNGYLAYRVA
jgi:hypothetical protein